ncbi:Os01g0568950, partial [Oryza sativa Japonica Group]
KSLLPQSLTYQRRLHPSPPHPSCRLPPRRRSSLRRPPRSRVDLDERRLHPPPAAAALTSTTSRLRRGPDERRRLPRRRLPPPPRPRRASLSASSLRCGHEDRRRPPPASAAATRTAAVRLGAASSLCHGHKERRRPRRRCLQPPPRPRRAPPSAARLASDPYHAADVAWAPIRAAAAPFGKKGKLEFCPDGDLHSLHHRMPDSRLPASSSRPPGSMPSRFSSCLSICT